MTEIQTPVRHLLATLAYRGGKAIRDAPERFGKLRAGEGSRTAVEILAHMCDVLAWGTSLAKGEQAWDPQPVEKWPPTVDRFHRELAAFDAALATGEVDCEAERLVQGPIADCLTHVGQLALLRGLAGARVLTENYSLAKVRAGSVGPEQLAPDEEF